MLPRSYRYASRDAGRLNFAPARALRLRAHARRPARRVARVTPPDSRAHAISPAAAATETGGPPALDLALACLARMAGGARHRHTRKRSSPGIAGAFACSGRGRAVVAWGGRPWPMGAPLANSYDVGREPTWGAPRIHGELLKLGIDVSQATVTKYMGRQRRPPSQTWRTFLTNQVGQIVAADLFVVPTATCRVLFVLVLLAHERQRVAQVAVTARPTARWTAQQLREAFPWDTAPRYLLRDRDHSFTAWAKTASAMEIREILTAPRPPWQNAYAERFIGSVRRECLDHVNVLVHRDCADS